MQVTGAGLDRLDQPALTRLGIPVANVPGGSNSAVAEYAVTSASLLLRRLSWANAEIRKGRYVEFRAQMLRDNLAGLEGLLVGLVGFGVIGVAVAQAFHRMGCRICYHDPASPNAAAAQALGATAAAARRTAADRRCRQPACAADPGHQGADRRARACRHEEGRGADPGLARRHRR